MSWNPLSTRIKEIEEIEEIERKHAGLTRNAKECCIYKVHKQLRDVSEKAYEPVLLAIGPYNDQGKVGQGFMEEHKLRYLRQMLKRTEGSLDTYINTLKELKEAALKCYGEHISQTSDDQFVEMMVLDGCFIIELFHKFAMMSFGIMEDDPIFQMKWVLPRIARDLLLLENQLPFFVLAKLFEMSESNNISKNLEEHGVDIDEEKDGISVERSTSTAQISQTQLIYLALKFFSYFLPFQWNVNASSYNSTKTIKRLLCFAHEALTPSLTGLVCQRLKVGFKFKNVGFEHLLGLIHTTICISLLDTEIDHARECQEAGAKLKMAEIFKHLFGLSKAISHASEFQRPGSQFNMRKIKENWEAINYPYGLELRKVGIEFNMAMKFQDKLDEDRKWRKTPFGIELQEAGIEFNKAEKFMELFEQNRNKGREPKPCETRPQMVGAELNVAKIFKRLLSQIKIENWKSIPHGQELCDAGVEFSKAKKFKCLHALREIKHKSMHNATELEEAGIKFKNAEKSNVFSIKFNNGLMEISHLSIQDHTETYLRNLIAYEQYCDRRNGSSYVHNYVNFMDDLINSPKDVELLRRKGIISNHLGDDEIISTMVNKLGHYISYSTNIYSRTSANVNMHCRRRRNVWMEKLRSDYFNSPWALISFLAAVLLLALTLVQTIFSII